LKWEKISTIKEPPEREAFFVGNGKGVTGFGGPSSPL
jgi:hypothetical protein